MSIYLFFLPIIIGAILLGMIAGPVGSLMIWTNTTSMAEAISHASLLGLVIYHLKLLPHPMVAVLFPSMIIASFAFANYRSNGTTLYMEGTIQRTSQTIVAVAIASIYNSPETFTSLGNILSGEMLAIQFRENIILISLAIILLLIISTSLHSLLSPFIDRELSILDGRRVDRWAFITIVMLSIYTGVLVAYFGPLLTTSILLGPSSLANKLASSPQGAMVISSLISISIMLTGLLASLLIVDMPPSCIIAGFSFLLILVEGLLDKS